MKLLYANNHLYRRGGAECVMFDEAQWFAARGHETYFFGHRHKDAEAMPFASLFPEPVDYNSVRGIAKARAAARIVNNRDAARRIERLLRETRPELMHCHNIYAGLTPAIVNAAARQGVPAVLTLHDYKLACPSYLMLDHGHVCDACVGGTFLHCVVRRCHKDSLLASAVSTVESIFNARSGRWASARFYICPSQFIRSVMIRHGYPAEKLRYIPNGIDLERWPVGSDGEGYALFVGRLSHEKGLDTLVRASVGARLPVCIVGDGPERQNLITLAERLGANVRFDGYRAGAELQAKIRGAAFVVVPSRCFENAPLTIIEAMAVGKAVVASDVGGIPELLEGGASGILVPPGDVQRLREAMERLAGDSGLRRSMGASGRGRAEENYSMKVHAERLMALYEEALDTSRESGSTWRRQSA